MAAAGVQAGAGWAQDVAAHLQHIQPLLTLAAANQLANLHRSAVAAAEASVSWVQEACAWHL